MVVNSNLQAKIAKILAAYSDQKPLDIVEFQPVLAEVSQLLNAAIGHKLLTFTVLHPSNEYVIRLFSNQMGDYALEDTKPMVKDEWTKLVIDDGQCFYVSTAKEMQPIFPDYQKLVNMGIGSAMNIPLCHDGKTIGTANLLDVDGAYKNVDFTPLIKICDLATPIFVAYRTNNC